MSPEEIREALWAAGDPEPGTLAYREIVAALDHQDRSL